MKPWQKLLALGAGALLAAAAIGGHFEGTKLHAYADVAGVWTICTGHTEGVKPGDTATEAQCQTWLSQDMAKANAGIKACITRPLTAEQETALTDFAYNVGVPSVCRSTLVALLNRGESPAVWCKQLLRWTEAGGKELPGLVKRRRAEYALCIEGLP